MTDPSPEPEGEPLQPPEPDPAQARLHGILSGQVRVMLPPPRVMSTATRRQLVGRYREAARTARRLARVDHSDPDSQRIARSALSTKEECLTQLGRAGEGELGRALMREDILTEAHQRSREAGLPMRPDITRQLAALRRQLDRMR